MRLFLCFAALIAINFSCSSCRKDKPDPGTTQSIVNKWYFKGMLHTDSNTAENKPSSIKEMNIVFSDSSKFSAKSSCNRMFGNYEASATGSLAIEGLSMTLMYCMSDTVMAWERKYSKGLKGATNYKIEGDQLTIVTDSGVNLLFLAN